MVKDGGRVEDMAHVFISYSHKDSDYAHALAGELSRCGIEAWVDDRIDYGTNWPRAIQENLNTRPVFIVVMTPNSYQSDWVQNEVSYAQGKRKTIFPILLDGDIWVSLAAKQHFDARGGRLPSSEFINDIKQSLGIREAVRFRKIAPDDFPEFSKWLGTESNKYYFIVAKHSEKCLDVKDASTENAANVFQYDIHGGLHQQWTLGQLPDGYYIIVARHSGKVLDVQDHSKDNCGNVFQYQLHGEENQKWEIRSTRDGYNYIKSKASGKALDVQDGSIDNAANVFQYELWKGDNQKWKFVEVPVAQVEKKAAP
jgi:hypothetical protein